MNKTKINHFMKNNLEKSSDQIRHYENYFLRKGY
jgi:hypothetical protein